MFWIDIEDANGARLGAGPIRSATSWQATRRLDRAGSFAFALPASDPKARLLAPGRVAAIYDDLGAPGGAPQYVGGGIIDQIGTAIGEDGTVMLSVSGDDMLRELTWRSVGGLGLAADGAAISHAAAVAGVAAYAPPGWTLAADPAPGHDSIYGQFAGESVLAAALAVAMKSRDHVWLDGRRTLRFASAWTASGVRAVQGPAQAVNAGAAAEVAAIKALSVEQSSYDLISRIHPRGAGQAQAALTLRATTRTAPAGYVLSTASNYLEATAVGAAYGRRERYVDFKDISPLSNTVADVRAAADMLFDAALYWLLRHSAPVTSYRISLVGCGTLLRPMQTLRVIYRDPASGTNLDANLYILETTWAGDADGLRTVDLVVADSDQWPDSDSLAVAESIQQGTVYEAHPQLNANSYAIPYTKHLDLQSQAEFRFRLDDEVTQLTRVTFDFKLLPLESTVKLVGAASVTAAANGDHSHTVTIAAHSHTVTIPDHSHSVTVPGHSHTVTVPGHSHTVTVPGHSHTVTVPGHSHGVPDHQHRIRIGGSSAPTYPVGFSAAGTSGGLVSAASASDFNLPTNSDSGSTTSSSTSDNVKTSSSTTDNVKTSSSTSDATQTSSSQAAQALTSGDGGGNSQTSGDGGATTTSSTSGGSHTHTVLPEIKTVYGIYRDADGDTLGLNDLEYSLDGTAWHRFMPGVNGYTTLGDGWTRVDLTALLQEPVTLRPANTNNLVRLRARAASDELLVVDHDNHRVQVFTLAGAFVRKWGSYGAGAGQFALPAGVAVGDGTVFVTDTGNHRVQVFTLAGAFVRQWGAVGSGNGQFVSPTAITVGPDGNVYVADGAPGTARVQVFTPAGTFLRKWSVAQPFNGLGADAEGNIYCAGSVAYKVQVFTATGTLLRQWGASGSGDGQFYDPAAVAVVRDRVWVGDAATGRVQMFTTAGAFLAKVVGYGFGAGKIQAARALTLSAGRLVVLDNVDGTYQVEMFGAIDGAPAGSWGGYGIGDGELAGPTGAAMSLGLVGQRATVDAQLTVRSIIQAVAYL